MWVGDGMMHPTLLVVRDFGDTISTLGILHLDIIIIPITIPIVLVGGTLIHTTTGTGIVELVGILI